MSRVPLQTGNPTLVPNFYPARSSPDPSGRGIAVLGYLSPSAIIAADARVAATNTVTVGGTAHTGDVCNVTLTSGLFPNGALTYSYTVQSTDTLSTIAQAIAKLINDDGNAHNFDIEADSAGAVVTISQAGPAGNFTTLTVSVTGGGATTTLTAGAASFSGGSGPVIPYENFTWATTLPGGGSGPLMTFYYGVPQDVPSNVLSQMISQGAPIL